MSHTLDAQGHESGSSAQRQEPEADRPPDHRRDWLVACAYGATGVLAVVLVLAYIRPWTEGSFEIFPEGWDLTWMQSMFVVHGQSGPFGVTANLAFPDSFSPWSYPQLGMTAAVFAWITVGILGISSALALWLFIAFAAGLNAMALLYFFRGVLPQRFLPLLITLAATTGASPFVLSRVHNANLIPFFLLPLMLGVLVRWPDTGRRYRWLSLVLVALAAMVSPLWWVTVAVMLLPLMALPGLVRRAWAEVGSHMAVLATVMLGFAVQSVVYLNARPADFVDDRDPWQSNWFGGHLSDALLSSPWLTEHVEPLQRLTIGSSGDLGKVGLVGGIAAIAAIILLVAGPPRQWRGVDTGVLSSATIVSTLFFILGGLGNFQAALAVFAGTVSPARVWSRMLLVLAIVGIGWLLLCLRAWAERRSSTENRVTFTAISVGLSVVCLGTWAMDASATARAGWNGTSLPVAMTDMPEYAPVSYITSHTQPCPVAELPLNGMPSWRVFKPYDNVYRGLVPYIMAPEWFWSIGSYSTLDTSGLSALPPKLEASGLVELQRQGFCAVLYDKSLSRAADEQGQALQAQNLGSLPAPDFQTDRYNVYLLNSGK